MENQNQDYNYNNVIQIEDSESTSRKYLASVFVWMFVALGISAFTTFEFFANASLMDLIVDPVAHRFTGLGYLAIFAPVAFSFVISFGFNRISYPAMLFLFITYAVTIGVSLSIFGLIYTASSIFGVFLSSAVVFGIMAIAGYTTHMDLTKFGSILIMIFFAAFAVGLINFFLGSAQLQYLLSFVFVAIMIGLTAYYMQMLKRIGAGMEFGTDSSKKLVLIGAFVLYTTFINLFTSMLRIFGGRR
ncbi:Bax inhibitor-1/YccA family protein [Mucilaginibacter sp. McL0603]|uniref:Bax inhibitor-1/YccA family protein n=1 Tax=Mucilaginibacter sp. McL0603 TaxID=3415670 RepID=UPI003CF5D7CC